jgi:Phosphopantetheine attachment site
MKSPGSERIESVDALVAEVVAVLGRRLEAASYGPDDDFFTQGGTSFLAALCTADLRKRGITVAVQDLFVATTPRALAYRIQPLQRAQ